MPNASNFAFLKEHDPIFLQLARAAEQAFSADPNTTLIKLRQLGEAFAQDMAARCGIAFIEMHMFGVLYLTDEAVQPAEQPKPASYGCPFPR